MSLLYWEALPTYQVVSCALIKTLLLDIYLARAILEAVPKVVASAFVVRRIQDLHKDGKKPINVWNLQITYSL